MITFDLSSGSATKRATQRSVEQIPDLRPFLTRARNAVPITGEVSVLLTTDDRIRNLNRTFRGKNKPTDVLSFPAPPPPGNKPGRRRKTAQSIAGDLAISLDTAQRQAQQFRHSLQVELKILLLHGLLHLAGYDHETDTGEMAEREDQLRRRFRLPGTLIARTAATLPGSRPVAAIGGHR